MAQEPRSGWRSRHMARWWRAGGARTLGHKRSWRPGCSCGRLPGQGGRRLTCGCAAQTESGRPRQRSKGSCWTRRRWGCSRRRAPLGTPCHCMDRFLLAWRPSAACWPAGHTAGPRQPKRNVVCPPTGAPHRPCAPHVVGASSNVPRSLATTLCPLPAVASDVLDDKGHVTTKPKTANPNVDDLYC